jgi:ferredoxin--NADP+ reductase
LTDAVACFRVRPDGGIPQFEPGQYLTLGTVVEDRLLQRPYSTASTRRTDPELEFLIRRVPGGTLTPHLWQVPIGARLHLGRAKGLFKLQPDDPRTHLFIATGTGLAPFVSMVGAMLQRPRPPRAIVVHGVAMVEELAYRDRLEGLARSGHDVVYVPAISRPGAPENATWNGLAGRLDGILPALLRELEVNPAQAVAYLCGNPGMIANVEGLLAARGFEAGCVRSEEYWPARAA